MECFRCGAYESICACDYGGFRLPLSERLYRGLLDDDSDDDGNTQIDDWDPTGYTCAVTGEYIEICPGAAAKLKRDIEAIRDAAAKAEAEKAMKKAKTAEAEKAEKAEAEKTEAATAAAGG